MSGPIDVLVPPSLPPPPPPPVEELLAEREEDEGAELHPELDPGLEEEDQQFEVLETVGEMDAGLGMPHSVEDEGPMEDEQNTTGLLGWASREGVRKDWSQGKGE